MNEVAAHGRTVLFVSHNPAALQRLCKKGIYLERGSLKSYGEMRTVLAQYQADVDAENEFNLGERQSAETVAENDLRFINWRLLDASTEQPHLIFSREEAVFELTLVCKRRAASVHFKLMIQDSNGQNAIIAHNLSSGTGETQLTRGVYKIRWRVPLPLRAGTYKVLAEVYSTLGEGILDLWDAAPRLQILPVLEYNLPEDFQSLVNVPVSFEIKTENKL